MLYLHETVDVRVEHVDEFGPRLAEVYRPVMEAAGARLVALWETVPLFLPWPQFICLWEIDTIADIGHLLRAQYQDKRDGFAAWRAELGQMSTRTEGRMLTPSPKTPSLAELGERTISLATCVHEWIETAQNQGENYCRQLETRYAPFAPMFNRVFVGTYHEIWNNKEAINIWALPDEFTVFPGGQITANNLSASEDIESWIVMSVGLREGYHSGLLRQVDVGRT
jgi:hypothetical protein